MLRRGSGNPQTSLRIDTALLMVALPVGYGKYDIIGTTLPLAAAGGLSRSAISRWRFSRSFRSWFLATIFRGHRASFGRSLARRGRQLMSGGVMRSENKEYRQRKHRPSYQHENPVEKHHDIYDTNSCLRIRGPAPVSASPPNPRILNSTHPALPPWG